jgi:hypothetical protein
VKKESIMVIRASKRHENIEALQRILTEYGCSIKMRLGLHEAGDACSEDGLIILQMIDLEGEVDKFKEELNKLSGIRYDSIEI